MKNQKSFFYTRRRALCAALAVSCLVLCARHFHAYGQDKSDFPDGYDAVQAAPKSHRVIFENAFVRVLEVTVSPGTTVPMHHHRWPSLLLSWDTGGKTPYSLPSPGWERSRHSEHERGNSSRHMEC